MGMSSFLAGKPVKFDSDPGALNGLVAVHDGMNGCLPRCPATKGLLICGIRPEGPASPHPIVQ